MEAMTAGGMPPNTRTAYIAVRAAVNAGRQQEAEEFAAQLTVCRGVTILAVDIYRYFSG